jgi:hypothetical protein
MDILQNVPSLNGADNMPGVGTAVYFAPKRDFQNIAAPAEGEVEILSNHSFNPGKGFIEIYNSLKSGELTSDSKGDIDGYYQEQKYMGFIPGIRSIVMKNFRKIQNLEGIAIVVHNGQMIQLGSKDLPAYMKIRMKTGKVGADDVAGYEMEIYSADISTWFYKGTLTLIPTGVIANGVSSFSVPAVDPGKVFVAKAVLGAVEVVLGSVACAADDTTTTLATKIKDQMVANGFTATSTADVVNWTGASAYNGWNFSIIESTNTFTGSAFITIGNSGADGDTISLRCMFNGLPFVLGTHTKTTGQTPAAVATALAAASSANPLGLTVAASGANVNVSCDPELGLVFDGAYLFAPVTGTLTQTATQEQRTF